MDIPKMEEFKEMLLGWWQNLVKKSDEDDIAGLGRERIVVFVVAFILALCFWFMVNLSRDYNLNIDLPIQLGAVPTEKALAEELPERATVSVNGEGWKLLNLYNNPPTINIDVSESEVNLYDQAQQQMNSLPAISIQKVQPLIITVELEDRVSKKVPIRSNVDISFAQQYDFVGSPSLRPDSVTITGAASLVRNIDEWATDSVQLSNISTDVSRAISLQSSGELLSISQEDVMYNASVAQYTEGEARVAINTRNLPQGRLVSYSPSSITVKYDVPIDEYTQIQNQNTFRAFVTYQQIQRDSTGFVTPQIEQSANNYNIRVRTFQPRNIAYFMVLDNQE
ncbi:MAG: CdaR family protein [Fodinibius sp.]|nr:CdaR family protein [Fodinibius sp.]